MKIRSEEINLKREEEGGEKRMDDDHPCLLPLEVIMEDILTRVSVRDVMNCSCVCKLWYKKILKDPHFASAYLEKSSSQKADASLLFYLFNVIDDDPFTPKWPVFNHFFSVDYDDEEGTYTDKELDTFRSILTKNTLHLNHKLLIDGKEKFELVGNCNGLICVSMSSSKTKGAILILNLSRDHTLFITRPIIDGYTIICYGLGFDSLTHEYMVVLIARCSTTTTIDANNDSAKGNNQLFKCLVFTLGKNSWRETTTSTTISLLLGGVGKTTTTSSFYKSSIFCGGALFWRSRSSDKQAAAGNMLLSFDLRDDKFQLIPLPAECASSISSMPEQQQIVDPLLEFKGYPCFACVEKTILRGGSCSNTSSTDHKKNNTSTSYCFKVHLHILKDKVLQLWIKETFDVAPLPYALPTSSAVPCFLKNTDVPPPTRIVSLSDQVFLYCFDGQSMQLYNLLTKGRKCASGRYRHFDIFTRKECSPPPPNFNDDDDNNNNLYEKMDYHLSIRINNFLLSLQAFIPKGAPKVEFDDIERILDDPQTTFVGYLCVSGEESSDCYLF